MTIEQVIGWIDARVNVQGKEEDDVEEREKDKEHQR